MSKLLSVNILNREYIDNINKCIEDARRFINYEDKEYVGDEWAEDAISMFHPEIIQPVNIRIGNLSDILSYDEQDNYGLLNIDDGSYGYMYIDTGNNKYIAVADFLTLEAIYKFIVDSKKIINLKDNWRLIFVPIQITQNMELKEKKELLDRLYEFIEDLYIRG